MSKIATAEETYTHPLGWEQYGMKCAECEDRDAHLHPKIQNQYGLCQTCYSIKWQENLCMAPGCDSQARDAGTDKHGVYCDEHYALITDGDGWCSVVGCPRAAELTVNEYPLCADHAQQRMPFSKWEKREKRDDHRHNGNGRATTATTHTPATPEEEAQFAALSVQRLAAVRTGGGRNATLAMTEILARLREIFTSIDPDDNRLEQLDELLPPRVETGELSQPPPIKVEAKAGKKPANKSTAKPTD